MAWTLDWRHFYSGRSRGGWPIYRKCRTSRTQLQGFWRDSTLSYTSQIKIILPCWDQLRWQCEDGKVYVGQTGRAIENMHYTYQIIWRFRTQHRSQYTSGRSCYRLSRERFSWFSSVLKQTETVSKFQIATACSHAALPTWVHEN
jgi:hypothetical protein